MLELLKKCGEVLKETGQAFRKDNGFNLAAALSFYTLLAFIPLSMIVVSLLGHSLGRSEEASNEIIGFISGAIPALTPAFLEALHGIIDRPWTSGWVGAIFLFLFASVLFTSLEETLDKVFRAIRSRNFFHSRLLAIAFICLAAILLFVPATLTNLDAFLIRHHVPIPFIPWLQGHLFFFLVGWVSFVLIVAVVPNHHVEWRYNLAGGFVFALLLVAAKYVFRAYTILSLERLNLVYGWMSALILIVIWIYFLVTLLILTAEWVAVLQRRGKESS